VPEVISGPCARAYRDTVRSKSQPCFAPQSLFAANAADRNGGGANDPDLACDQAPNDSFTPSTPLFPPPFRPFAPGRWLRVSSPHHTITQQVQRLSAGRGAQIGGSKPMRWGFADDEVAGCVSLPGLEPEQPAPMQDKTGGLR